MDTLRQQFHFRATCVLMVLVFLGTSIIDPAYAQVMALPQPGHILSASPAFTPVTIKGLGIDPKNPLTFDFYMDQGDSGLDLDSPAFQVESHKLVKYFLSALTIPEEDMWVNLSPHESDRVVPEAFGQTAMGRDLLAQDYILKQLTASLIYPEDDLGKEFWQRVYREAYDKYGTSDVPTDMFHKVWIVPDNALLYQNENNIFTVENRLKVLMEEDYVARQHNLGDTRYVVGGAKDQEGVSRRKKGVIPASELGSRSIEILYQVRDDDSPISTQIMKEVVLPAIEREVNEGKHFASLRQIYSAMILATWYKRNLKKSLLAQVYVDQSKGSGERVEGKEIDAIYDQYLQHVKQGAFDYIKEEAVILSEQSESKNLIRDPSVEDSFRMTENARDDDRMTYDREGNVVPRRYFSGGANSYFGVDVPVTGDKSMTANIEATANVRIILRQNDSALLSRVSMDPLNHFYNEARQLEQRYGDALRAYSKKELRGQRAYDVINDLDEEVRRLLQWINSYQRRAKKDGNLDRLLTRYRAAVEERHARFVDILYLRSHMTWPRDQRNEDYVDVDREVEQIKRRWNAGIGSDFNQDKEWRSKKEKYLNLDAELSVMEAQLKQIEHQVQDQIIGKDVSQNRSLKLRRKNLRQKVRNQRRKLRESSIQLFSFQRREWSQGDADTLLKEVREQYIVERDVVDRIQEKWLKESGVAAADWQYTGIDQNPEFQREMLRVTLQEQEIFYESLLNEVSSIQQQQVRARNIRVVIGVLVTMLVGFFGWDNNRSMEEDMPEALVPIVPQAELPGTSSTETFQEPVIIEPEQAEINLVVPEPMPEENQETTSEGKAGVVEEDENAEEKKPYVPSEVQQQLNEILEKMRENRAKLAGTTQLLDEKMAALKELVGDDEEEEEVLHLEKPKQWIKAGPSNQVRLGLVGWLREKLISIGGVINKAKYSRMQSRQLSFADGHLSGKNIVLAELVEGDVEYLAQGYNYAYDPINGWFVMAEEIWVDRTELLGQGENDVVVDYDRHRGKTYYVMAPPFHVINSIETERGVSYDAVEFDEANGGWRIQFSRHPGQVRLGYRLAQENELPQQPALALIDEQGEVLTREQAEAFFERDMPPDLFAFLKEAQSYSEQDRRYVRQALLDAKLFFYSTHPNLNFNGSLTRTRYSYFAQECEGFSTGNFEISYMLKLDDVQIQTGYFSKKGVFATHDMHTWNVLAKDDGSQEIWEGTRQAEAASPLWDREDVSQKQWGAEWDLILTRKSAVMIRLPIIMNQIALTIQQRGLQKIEAHLLSNKGGQGANDLQSEVVKEYYQRLFSDEVVSKYDIVYDLGKMGVDFALEMDSPSEEKVRRPIDMNLKVFYQDDGEFSDRYKLMRRVVFLLDLIKTYEEARLWSGDGVELDADSRLWSPEKIASMKREVLVRAMRFAEDKGWDLYEPILDPFTSLSNAVSDSSSFLVEIVDQKHQKMVDPITREQFTPEKKGVSIMASHRVTVRKKFPSSKSEKYQFFSADPVIQAWFDELNNNSTGRLIPVLDLPDETYKNPTYNSFGQIPWQQGQQTIEGVGDVRIVRLGNVAAFEKYDVPLSTAPFLYIRSGVLPTQIPRPSGFTGPSVRAYMINGQPLVHVVGKREPNPGAGSYVAYHFYLGDYAEQHDFVRDGPNTSLGMSEPHFFNHDRLLILTSERLIGTEAEDRGLSQVSFTQVRLDEFKRFSNDRWAVTVRTGHGTDDSRIVGHINDAQIEAMRGEFSNVRASAIYEAPDGRLYLNSFVERRINTADPDETILWFRVVGAWAQNPGPVFMPNVSWLPANGTVTDLTQLDVSVERVIFVGPGQWVAQVRNEDGRVAHIGSSEQFLNDLGINQYGVDENAIVQEIEINPEEDKDEKNTGYNYPKELLVTKINADGAEEKSLVVLGSVAGLGGASVIPSSSASAQAKPTQPHMGNLFLPRVVHQYGITLTDSDLRQKALPWYRYDLRWDHWGRRADSLFDLDIKLVSSELRHLIANMRHGVKGQFFNQQTMREVLKKHKDDINVSLWYMLSRYQKLKAKIDAIDPDERKRVDAQSSPQFLRIFGEVLEIYGLQDMVVDFPLVELAMAETGEDKTRLYREAVDYLVHKFELPSYVLLPSLLPDGVTQSVQQFNSDVNRIHGQVDLQHDSEKIEKHLQILYGYEEMLRPYASGALSQDEVDVCLEEARNVMGQWQARLEQETRVGEVVDLLSSRVEEVNELVFAAVNFSADEEGQAREFVDVVSLLSETERNLRGLGKQDIRLSQEDMQRVRDFVYARTDPDVARRYQVLENLHPEDRRKAASLNALTRSLLSADQQTQFDQLYTFSRLWMDGGYATSVQPLTASSIDFDWYREKLGVVANFPALGVQMDSDARDNFNYQWMRKLRTSGALWNVLYYFKKDTNDVARGQRVDDMFWDMLGEDFVGDVPLEDLQQGLLTTAHTDLRVLIIEWAGLMLLAMRLRSLLRQRNRGFDAGVDMETLIMSFIDRSDLLAFEQDGDELNIKDVMRSIISRERLDEITRDDLDDVMASYNDEQRALVQGLLSMPLVRADRDRSDWWQRLSIFVPITGLLGVFLFLPQATRDRRALVNQVMPILTSFDEGVIDVKELNIEIMKVIDGFAHAPFDQGKVSPDQQPLGSTALSQAVEAQAGDRSPVVVGKTLRTSFQHNGSPSRFMGVGGTGDFEELRPYTEGDDVRRLRIDPSTGQPYVTVHRDEREVEVSIVLDMRHVQRMGPAAWAKQAHSALKLLDPKFRKGFGNSRFRLDNVWVRTGNGDDVKLNPFNKTFTTLDQARGAVTAELSKARIPINIPTKRFQFLSEAQQILYAQQGGVGAVGSANNTTAAQLGRDVKGDVVVVVGLQGNQHRREYDQELSRSDVLYFNGQTAMSIKDSFERAPGDSAMISDSSEEGVLSLSTNSDTRGLSVSIFPNGTASESIIQSRKMLDKLDFIGAYDLVKEEVLQWSVEDFDVTSIDQVVTILERLIQNYSPDSARVLAMNKLLDILTSYRSRLEGDLGHFESMMDYLRDQISHNILADNTPSFEENMYRYMLKTYLENKVFADVGKVEIQYTPLEKISVKSLNGQEIAHLFFSVKQRDKNILMVTGSQFVSKKYRGLGIMTLLYLYVMMIYGVNRIYSSDIQDDGAALFSYFEKEGLFSVEKDDGEEYLAFADSDMAKEKFYKLIVYDHAMLVTPEARKILKEWGRALNVGSNDFMELASRTYWKPMWKLFQNGSSSHFASTFKAHLPDSDRWGSYFSSPLTRNDFIDLPSTLKGYQRFHVRLLREMSRFEQPRLRESHGLNQFEIQQAFWLGLYLISSDKKVFSLTKDEVRRLGFDLDSFVNVLSALEGLDFQRVRDKVDITLRDKAMTVEEEFERLFDRASKHIVADPKNPDWKESWDGFMANVRDAVSEEEVDLGKIRKLVLAYLPRADVYVEKMTGNDDVPQKLLWRNVYTNVYRAIVVTLINNHFPPRQLKPTIRKRTSDFYMLWMRLFLTGHGEEIIEINVNKFVEKYGFPAERIEPTLDQLEGVRYESLDEGYRVTLLSEQVGDGAMNADALSGQDVAEEFTPGGIDLNPVGLSLTVQGEGGVDCVEILRLSSVAQDDVDGCMPFNFTPEQIEQMRRDIRGFTPVMVHIKPIADLPKLLGI